MNKKEILEIKKQFTENDCIASRISGCYVDSGKNIRADLKEALGSLPEEERAKYIDIFRKVLSGAEGKTLINLDFPLDQEKPSGTQAALLALKNSHLQNSAFLDSFYDSIIQNYDCDGNYYIILATGAYDIPGKAKDGIAMDDASDKVYEFLLCAICPVNQSKPGLCYNEPKSTIEDRICDWVVGAPENGFLFPAFNGRETDIHSMLYFAKKPDKAQPMLLQNVFGCQIPYSAKEQKELFNGLVADTLGEECNFRTVLNMGEMLDDTAEKRKEMEEQPPMTGGEVKNILLDSGAPEDCLDDLEDQFSSIFTGTNGLLASNLVTGGAQVRLPGAVVSADPDISPRLEVTVINGKKYIAVPIDGPMEVNGIIVKG